MRTLRPILCAVALATAFILPAQGAETYPGRDTITIIVPFGAGASTDSLARVVADRLSSHLDGTFIVQNRPGAGGNIGSSYVAKAKPDGRTLLIASNGPLAANASLYSTLPYDPVTDFSQVFLLGTLPMVLIKNPNAPSMTLNDIVQESTSASSPISFGASNTTARVWVEMLNKEYGLNAKTVLYTKVGDLMADIAGGQLHYAFENVGPSRPFIESGQVDAVAYTSDARVPFAPNVPTVAESGFTKRKLPVWFMVMAPKNTPPAIINTLNTALNSIMQSGELDSIASQINLTLAGGSPDDALTFQKAEMANWHDLVDLTGVTID